MKTIKDAQHELNKANLALNEAMRSIVNVSAFLANLAQVQEAVLSEAAQAAPAQAAAPTPAPQTLAEKAAGVASHMGDVAEMLRTHRATPTPQAPTQAAPTAATPTLEAAAPAPEPVVDGREAQEFLARTLYQPAALFAQFFSPEVYVYGRGPIAPSESWPAYKEDVSVVPKAILTHWPTGFYRSEDGNPQFFLSIEGRFFGWTTFYKDGTKDFSFYSQDPADNTLYHASLVTDLTDAKRLFGNLKNAFEGLMTRGA